MNDKTDLIKIVVGYVKGIDSSLTNLNKSGEIEKTEEDIEHCVLISGVTKSIGFKAIDLIINEYLTEEKHVVDYLVGESKDVGIEFDT